ncbi:hypothetical protein NH26_08600 [Flammeovirga pacifica]|uniref:Uncharacterized protein n=2 Tax=Flammeovirga pacifica TaxID=915059 RepID=A0A1S1YZI2_FLAPC|nr:hypothetical protein NH26_08600 [Flammeovirga pacifica]
MDIKFENYLQKERLQILIDELIQFDLIENEEDENTFYITPHGYEFLDDYVEEDEEEYVTEKLTDEQLMEKINFFGIDKFKYYLFTWFILFMIILTTFIYYKISNSSQSDIEDFIKGINTDQIQEVFQSDTIKSNSNNDPN